MRGTVGKYSQDKFDIFTAQAAEIDINGIVLTFVDLTPLAKSSDSAVANLVFQFEYGIAVVSSVHAVDPGLEVIARLNPDRRVFSGDHAVSDVFRISDQSFGL